MQLKVYAVALRTLENVGPIASRIAREDRDLARQLRRAASSVLLNLAEGESHRDGHQRMRFATAIGSAMALGYVAKSEAVLAAKDGFDRVARTVTKLIRAGR